MTHMKTALVCAGATLLTIFTAQAADLPSRKAAAVEYVRVCDAYGTGFYWIPGTDTCLKVGGRVRIEAWYTPARNAVVHRSTGTPAAPAGTFAAANGIDTTGWFARGILNMDARTQSAWGTVQTVFALRLAAATGLANAPFGYATSVFSAGNVGNATIEAAYIRFAGFTVGQAASSFFLIPPYQLHSLYNGGFPNGVRQFAYTASFGNGFSATLGLENRGDQILTSGVNTLGANPFTATAATAAPITPQHLPALVGNIRVDQAWGTLMASALVQENTGNFTNPALVNTAPQIRRTGWAIGGGARFNLPMIAAGDQIQFWANYGVGTLDYMYGLGLNGNFAMTTNFLGGFLRVDRDLTLYCINAACTAGGVEQTKAFGATALFTHYWTPSLRSYFVGTYVQVTPGSVTQNTAWATGGLSKAHLWNVAGSLFWSPVRNFDIGAELSYAKLTQSLPLSAPAGLGTLAQVSPSNWTTRVRVERTF
jgi:hypothetical protein